MENKITLKQDESVYWILLKAFVPFLVIVIFCLFIIGAFDTEQSLWCVENEHYPIGLECKINYEDYTMGEIYYGRK